MKVQELRIGNRLYSGVVTAIFHDGTFHIFDGYQTWDSKYMLSDWLNAQPIQLTEEWLLKLGFNKVEFDELEYYELKTNSKFDIFSGDRNGFLEVVIALADDEVLRISQVHVLQNATYALTGQELNIKE